MAQSPYLLMGRQQQGQDPWMQFDPMAAQQPVQISGQPAMPMKTEAQPRVPNPMPSIPAPVAAPEQAQPSIEEQLMQSYQEQQALQSEAIKNAEDQLAAARSTPQKMDLSPLIALAEQWSGSAPNTLLRTYQPPTQNEKQIQALQEAVLKARGGASELSRMALKDRATLQESEAARRQRLEEIALRRGELKSAKEDRDAFKKQQQETEWREKFDKRFGDNISGLSEMAQNAKIARDIIAKKGRLPIYGDPEWTEYQGAVSSLLTRYNADKAKLGALAGADLKLLEKAVGTSIDSFDNLVKNVAGSGASGSIKVLDKILSGTDETVNNIGTRAKSVYGDQVMGVFDQAKSIYQGSRGVSPEAGSQGKPQTVIQNGITYTLNPNTGEYE